MTKLNRKLSISISILVILVSIISIVINSMFIHKYYLYEKKKLINNIGIEIKNTDVDNINKVIEDIEKYNNVTIIYTEIPGEGNTYNESINEILINEFWKKDITLKKFWLSEEAFNKLENQSVNKIYNQGKMKYSLLVKFIKEDNYIFAISTPIEHSQETIVIVNKFNIIINILSVIIVIVLNFILSENIIRPIKKLNKLSKDIALLKFRTENIKTNDEIEELADSINIMSVNLEKTHKELSKRNENLKMFIADASHELKTPIALIKAYSMGIKDDLDDGTYIDTIIEQSDSMSNIVNTLLYWAKYEESSIDVTRFDLKHKLNKVINKYKFMIKSNDIVLNIKLDEGDFNINADENGIDIVLDNLITNAIKYTSDKTISIYLLKDNGEIFLSIENGIENIDNKDIDNIWKPFYTLEKSRNKELSGTGLGLSIVKTIVENHKLEYGVKIDKNKIEFYIVF